MKLNIKKLYKDTVHQLEKHQVEISTALALVALVGFSAQDEDEKTARDELETMYNELLDVIKIQLDAINMKLEGDDDAA